MYYFEIPSYPQKLGFYPQKLGFYHQKLGFESVIFNCLNLCYQAKLTIKLTGIGENMDFKLFVQASNSRKSKSLQRVCESCFQILAPTRWAPNTIVILVELRGPFFCREKNARQSQFCKVIYRGSTTPLILSYLWAQGPTVSRDFPVVGRS